LHQNRRDHGLCQQGYHFFSLFLTQLNQHKRKLHETRKNYEWKRRRCEEIHSILADKKYMWYTT
jgi:hypothetical protein